VDAAGLRAEFPVLADRAYLNAGTCGPLPRAAVRAAAEMLERGMREGRTRPYFETTLDLRDRQRAAYAALLRAAPEDVALTTSTSESMVRVILGLPDLGPDDEVLTAPDEHPGLLGPLINLRTRRGVRVRTAPLADLADAVGPRTRLVACSHVSWITGEVAPAALAELPAEIPVLLDGAQGVGAVPVDVQELGCAFYAGAGQKWLCGPVGTGMLWIAPAWRERLTPAGLTYLNLDEPARGLDAEPVADARRHDAPSLSAENAAEALAALDVLATPGWAEVHERSARLAAGLAERLAERGFRVAPRGRTTLVSWEYPDAEAARDRLAELGIVVRNLPGTGYLRASVGAWNDEEDLERLLAAL
jgi:selenocysteine lyase/cysteine desulfurase